MITPGWIVCEHSSRWAAALRTELTHRSDRADPGVMHEVRSLPELTEQLRACQGCLVLIQATPENLEAVLTWLAEAVRSKKSTPTVVLLDCPSIDRDILAAVLREAGAADVIQSPRQLRPVVALGRRHAASCDVAISSRPQLGTSFERWAWSLLPWQETGGSLG